MFRLRTFILLIGTLLLFPSTLVHSDPKVDFYYFFPDSVQSNFSLLTREIYSFFDQKHVGSHFQAFTHEVDFDRLVRERKPGIVLVPEWYYDRYGKSLELKPLLTSLQQGQTTYTKVLLIHKKASLSSLWLNGKTVAVTNMGPDTGNQLDHYFKKEKLDFSKSNVIITPKDADAYYALVLGQVDAAVVGIKTIQEVSRTNPIFKEVTQEVAASDPIPMPLLCVTDGIIDGQRVAQLKQLFLQSGKQSPLPSFMQMLHISGWENGYL
jgi:ABC transporter, phosphonate, periplasmic substrate-binding protein